MPTDLTVNTHSLPLSAEPFLPHSRPMLFLNEILERVGNSAVASAFIGRGNICFSENGIILPEYCVEILAQTVAAANGYDAADHDQAPKRGFIVGLEQCSFHHIPQKECILLTKIVETMTFGAMKVIQGEVMADTTVIAAAELKVWEEAQGRDDHSPASPERGSYDNQSITSAASAALERSIGPCISHIQMVTREEGKVQVTARCLFPPIFCGFAGHFPGNPILPAIVQLATVRCLAEQALQKRLQPETYSRTKFRSMVRPDQEVFLQLDMTISQNSCGGKFSLRSQTDTSIATGSFVFRLL